MKKILSLLSSIVVVTSAGVSVVSCGDSSDSIGLLISNFDNAYFQNMMKAGKSYAKEKGYKLNTYDSKGDVSGATDQENVTSSMTKGDKAIIINPANVTTNKAIAPALKADTPVINIDTEYAESVGERGAAGFVSEQTQASDRMFKAIYTKIKGYTPDEEKVSDEDKISVYAMFSNRENDAERKRYKGFVINNLKWINLVNATGEGDYKGSTTAGNSNTGQAAGDTLTNEWTGANSAKNANIIWSGNDPMALGMRSAIDKSTTMKTWFDEEGKGYIAGFDGSEDVASDIALWSETARNHMYITVKQEYSNIVAAAIDKAIELIEANASGTKVPKTFEKSTEIAASLVYAPNEGPKAS